MDPGMDGVIARALLDHHTECVLLLDTRGRIETAFGDTREGLGLACDGPLEGRLWWSLWPEGAQEALRNAQAAALRGMVVTVDVPGPADPDRHWHLCVTRMHDAPHQGKLLASLQDATADFAAARTLRGLEADNEALRWFTRFVAHDLRGPIRQQKLLSQLIEERLSQPPAPDRDADLRDLAAKVGLAADGMLDLLSGLEALHRCEAGGALVAQPLIPLIDAALASVDPAPMLGIVAPCGGPVVSVQADQMIAAFVRILENAMAYGSVGAIVEMSVHIAPAEDGMVAIHIADDGPGFADDKVEALFQPLVRQSNSVGTHGAGIGLAIVRRILVRHGGDIRVVSRADRPSALPDGACLCLTLPLVSWTS